MTKDEIARIINPKYPWVYAPTTAPTRLLFKNGEIKIGFFQFTQQSQALEKDNKYTFIEFGEKAQNYRITGDDSFVTIVDANALENVEYPIYNVPRIPLDTIVRRIDVLRKALDKTNVDIQNLISLFRLDWGLEFHSNFSDEFNAGATQQILVHSIEKQSGGIGSELDYSFSNSTVHLLKEFTDTGIISKESLAQLHRVVCGGKGSYRDYEVTVYQKSPSDFKFLNPNKIELEIEKLLDWYKLQTHNENLHPLFLASIFHYQFVSIHPFPDGNGRLARVISSVILLRNKMAPPILQPEDRIYYLDSLQRADNGDLEAWLRFVGNRVAQSLEILLSQNQKVNVR